MNHQNRNTHSGQPGIKARSMKSVFVVIFAFGLFSWTSLVNPQLVFADDKNPAPLNDNSVPDFPGVTEEYTSSTTALYEVPLALNTHDHFYFYRPIAMDTNTDSLFNFRYGAYYDDGIKAHTGIDIGSPLHKPILAAGDGEVIFTGYGLMYGGGNQNDPYGIAVMIKHDFNYMEKSLYTVYAHLDGVTVEVGQRVSAGDQIGILGLTGNTSGPHVHFEVRVGDAEDGKVQNPELWLSPTVGSGVLAGLAKDDWGYLMATKKITLKSYETGKSIDFLTYADEKSIHPDDYFKENFTVADLPAGLYEISMLYKYKWYKTDIFISPGTVNFVYFTGKQGFVQKYPTSDAVENFLK